MAKSKQRKTKHIPQRTCIACRQKYDKRRLTRVVRTVDAGIIVDPSGKKNGRGAYICDSSACWQKVINNHQIINKALRIEITAEDKERLVANQPVSTQTS